MSPRRGAPRARWLALGGGAGLLVLCLACGRAAPRQALLSYLFAFLFFTGLSLGSLALLLVHALTGGEWGVRLGPQLVAAARTLPLQAALVLPLLFGMALLYPWAAPGAVAGGALLDAQRWYLESAFFVSRTLGCFVLWLVLVALFVRWQASRPSLLPRLAAGGLIVYALTTLVAATDWAMSLEPRWHSTSFGMLVATGWMLAAAALAVWRAAASRDDAAVRSPAVLRDLGNLLLLLVLGWSYLAYMQYLTVWIADLPSEASWYVPRTLSSWRWLAWALITGHFAVPFAVLLSRRAKEMRGWLGATAALLLFAQLLDALWLVAPGARPQGFSLRLTDLLAPAGMGLLWWAVYAAGPPLARLQGEPGRAHG